MKNEDSSSPRKGTAKELRAERNRQYRARRKERGVKRKNAVKELSAVLDAAAAERDALRTQQEGLYAHEAALCALGEHQAEMLHAASCSLDPPPAKAVEVEVPATQPGLLAAVCGQAQRLAAWCREVFSKAYYEGILDGYVTLTEEHMRGYLLRFADGDALVRFANQCVACTRLLEQHEAGASSLDARLLRLRKYRGTMARAVVKYRPDLLPVVLASMTPAPDPAAAGGGAAEEASLHTRLHPSLRFVADLEWTEEQRSALRPHWQLYKARVAAARREAVLNLAAVQRDAAAALSAWDSRPAQSASHAMAAYTSLADSTGGMDSWTRLEMVALVELGCAVLESITPLQALKMDVYSRPYTPDPSQICAWLLD